MFEIVTKEALNPTVMRMDVCAPLIAKKAKAGQFIILRLDEQGERIPLTIADYDREKGTVTIIFQKVGLTTELLGDLNEGDSIRDFVGPLGLPTELPDAYVDIRRLVSDEAYVSTLLDLLVDELLVSDTKLDQVVELIWNTPAYRQSVTGSVPELDLDDADTFRSLFRSLYQNNAQVRGLLDEQVRLLAHDYLTALQVDDITYDIDRIDLDDNIVDMLAENLDPEGTPDAKNTLHIYGTIANRLPLSAEIQARLRPTLIEVPVQIDAKSEENVIAETPIYGEDLRTLIHGCQVVIPVTLDRYYRNGFDNTADCQLLIELHLVKRGGLKLNL